MGSSLEPERASGRFPHLLLFACFNNKIKSPASSWKQLVNTCSAPTFAAATQEMYLESPIGTSQWSFAFMTPTGTYQVGTQTLLRASLSRFNAERAGKNAELPVSSRRGSTAHLHSCCLRMQLLICLHTGACWDDPGSLIELWTQKIHRLIN